MKTTLSIAALCLLGAQAINISQADTDASDTEEMMMTSYIGFEFEGPELAEQFSALDEE